MLIDTNIFIDFFKGREEAKQFLENNIQTCTSIIVVMEIIAGLPNKRSVGLFEKFLRESRITVVPITQEVSELAYQLFATHVHENHLGIPDALIAATALIFNFSLATRNTKHFKVVKKLQLVTPY